ncbi:urea transporter [Saccharopolyspora lacisalsi]|uniref:Urea transporter n=1 Tax=Halosaccharopolyspora lacisalsi TaxID=1000566 RepID=A0A839E088_9PSEU|nr:urea transporter [Halosaccharopolyspora lacisalsi]MBA8825157.1 urea transporter [Halosaccharopolyspora lacisalsi]
MSAESGVPESGDLPRGILRGIAQVYLQDNVVTGLLFLVGLLVAGPVVGLAALLGSAVGLATALSVRAPVERVARGFYGFNSTLVAVGAVVSFRPLWLALVAAVVAAAVAALLTRVADFFLRVPPYTAPFVFTYWPLLHLGVFGDWSSAPSFGGPLDLDADVWGVFGSEAAVFLVSGLLPGLFILAGLAASRWRLVGGALAASVVGLLVVELVPLFPADEIATGAYGFNAALVAVGMLSTGRGWRSCLLAVPAALLIQAAVEAVGLVPATFPFVLVMWTADLWRARGAKDAA